MAHEGHVTKIIAYGRLKLVPQLPTLKRKSRLLCQARYCQLLIAVSVLQSEMASLLYVALVAACSILGATAQETLAAVSTLATNASTDFVYVPSTTVSGAISVSCVVDLAWAACI